MAQAPLANTGPAILSLPVLNSTFEAPTETPAKLSDNELVSFVPLGYVRSYHQQGKSADINSEQSVLIKQAFELVANGQSLRKTHHHMVDAGLVSRTGKPISLATLHHIMRNPFYYGFIRHNGTVGRGNHQPLISKTQFETVQKNLKKRRC